MKKSIEFAILTTLICLSIFALVYTWLTDYIVDQPFYFGFGGIVIAFILRYLNEQVSNLLLAMLLLAGTFGLVTFFHIDFSFSFHRLETTLIKIQPIWFLALLLHLYANRENLIKLFGAPEVSEEMEVKMDSLKVARMKSRLQHKSKIELEDMLNNPSNYQKVAVLAAKELLTEGAS